MRKFLYPILALVLTLVLALPAALPASASPDQVTLDPDGNATVSLGLSFDPASVPPSLRSNWGVNTLDDGDTSHVKANANDWKDDLYTLQDPPASAGTVTKVTVYIKAKAETTGATQAGARTVISDGTEMVYGTGETLTGDYVTYSTEYVSKPFIGGGAWTWADISSLQAGVSLQRSKHAPGAIESRCTLVWVVVDYTPPPAGLTGQFRTQTQGGWGTGASGDNPGTYRDANFGGAFSSGLVIGDTTGGKSATFTTGAAIEAFLPVGGTPGALGDDYTDPTATGAGVLAGQVVALTLNVGFDLYDPDFSVSTINLKDLVVVNTESPCYGWTVQQVLDEANGILAGVISSLTPSQINGCVSAINENFVDGNMDGGFLALP